MPAPRKYPGELRERALRLVEEAMKEDPRLSLNAAVRRIGSLVRIVPDTLRGLAEQRRVDTGQTTRHHHRRHEADQGVGGRPGIPMTDPLNATASTLRPPPDPGGRLVRAAQSWS